MELHCPTSVSIHGPTHRTTILAGALLALVTGERTHAAASLRTTKRARTRVHLDEGVMVIVVGEVAAAVCVAAALADDERHGKGSADEAPVVEEPAAAAAALEADEWKSTTPSHATPTTADVALEKPERVSGSAISLAPTRVLRSAPSTHKQQQQQQQQQQRRRRR